VNAEVSEVRVGAVAGWRQKSRSVIGLCEVIRQILDCYRIIAQCFRWRGLGGGMQA
jgi:hypothetical protein